MYLIAYIPAFFFLKNVSKVLPVSYMCSWDIWLANIYPDKTTSAWLYNVKCKGIGSYMPSNTVLLSHILN